VESAKDAHDRADAGETRFREEWRSLAAVIGQPDLAIDPWWPVIWKRVAGSE